ncbi:GNAT family N-acetyltransferase [Lactobacillus mulieris]|uniref:N-acetyltransferase n=1 Tax=Lactobacillus mulieris TaxID=2508708 RepID=A0AAW5WXP8_9LACO|nr:N-acetyltransferase [Lactobacillus mulieris]MCZ3622061.1 N-acetyltransferase [Lactobacillus mulieris]MCZ3623758.1 N-acetyltransferase [Lactobacillus mulieris]MCZ3636068.1 N-acetyltransferase [Lactobacillus mulieris]MCZ3690001.1 N-acetyltransferase [Lactobacillus mulieris]MCZ3696180.1 N-acetyltransferase [Lactobacillus mulieris]
MFKHDLKSHNFYLNSNNVPEYRLHYHLIKNNQVMAIDHIFVSPEVKSDLVDELIRFALGYARDNNLKIMPLGPTILAYFKENQASLTDLVYKPSLSL